MEEIFHYIHAKFCYCKSRETNSTKGEPTSPSAPSLSSCETRKTLEQ